MAARQVNGARASGRGGRSPAPGVQAAGCGRRGFPAAGKALPPQAGAASCRGAAAPTATRDARDAGLVSAKSGRRGRLGGWPLSLSRLGCFPLRLSFRPSLSELAAEGWHRGN